MHPLTRVVAVAATLVLAVAPVQLAGPAAVDDGVVQAELRAAGARQEFPPPVEPVRGPLNMLKRDKEGHVF